MSEGPTNFGKPMLFLVLAGCIGGGIYAYLHWPSHYDAGGWEIDFPNKWEAKPFADPAAPEKVVAQGPLIEEGMSGVAWVTVNRHGTIVWPDFAVSKVPGTVEPTSMEDTEIGHKRTLLFEYEDENGTRWRGSAMQRGDAVVIAAIGCPKHLFATNRERFDKCVKSLRCSR